MLVFGILISSTLFTGCLGVDASFRSMRNYVMEAKGEQFDKEFEFSLEASQLGWQK